MEGVLKQRKIPFILSVEEVVTMGFFSAPAPTGLPQVSQERIQGLFDQEKWQYFVDNAGDLGGIWDNNTFYFLLYGQEKEILVVTARWHASLPFEYLDKVRALVNEWNRGALWPKCVHRTDDDGTITVTADVITDFTHGATDAQLSEHLRCGVSNLCRCFDSLSELLKLEPAGNGERSSTAN